jgi:hypothetical protein
LAKQGQILRIRFDTYCRLRGLKPVRFGGAAAIG